MTVFLTVQQVLFIHARVIAETGGEHGIRDLGVLQSAVARPQATFEGAELYPDPFAKAAALMESLARNHPFVDGNKRTAITSVALFSLRNGWQLETTNQELERFTLLVTDGRLALEAVEEWFRANSIEA